MGRRLAFSPRLIKLISFTCMSVVNYAFGLATGWLLVPGDFGLVAFVQTVLTITGLILNSGFAWSLTAALVGTDQARRAALARGALGANLLLALALSAVIVLLFGLGPLQPGLETWPIAALVALTLPLMAYIAIARATVQGIERFALLALIWIVETVCKAAAGVGLVLAGFGAAGAIAGFLVGALVATILAVALLSGRLNIRPWGTAQRPALRAARDMFGALLGMALLLNLDLVALKLFGGGDRAAVGYYQAGIVLANMPYYLTTAMIPVLFTQIARMKQIGQTGAVVGEALALVLVLILPIEIVLALAPETILGLLFPSAYGAGAAALRILAGGNSAIIVVAILSAAFQAAGNARIPARVLLTIVTLEAAALWSVAPIWGATGVAAVFSAATLTTLLGLALAYGSALGFQTMRPALGWLAKYAVALSVGGVIAAGVFAIGKLILLALGVGGSAYLCAALYLRLVHVPRLNLPARRLASAAKGK